MYEIEANTENSQTNLEKRKLLKYQQDLLENNMKEWKERNERLNELTNNQTENNNNNNNDNNNNINDNNENNNEDFETRRYVRTFSDVSDMEVVRNMFLKTQMSSPTLSNQMNNNNNNNTDGDENSNVKTPVRSMSEESDLLNNEQSEQPQPERKWRQSLKRFKTPDEITKHYKKETGSTPSPNTTPTLTPSSSKEHIGHNPFASSPIENVKSYYWFFLLFFFFYFNFILFYLF